MLRKTQHSVHTCRAMRVRSFSNLTFHSLFCLLDTLSPPPSSALHRVSSSRPLVSTLFFHRDPFFFFTQPRSPLYTRYAYILQLVVKHRAPCMPLFPPAERATTIPLWARTLSRPLSRSWPVPAGYKPSRDNH